MLASLRLTRPVIGWALYDAAVSFLMANGALYLPTWLVVENGIPGWALNAAIAGSTLLSLIIGPALGALADRRQRPVAYLKLASLCMVAVPVGLWVVVAAGTERPLAGWLGLAGLFVIFVAAQLGYVFYSSLLRKLRRVGDFAAASGVGVASSWLGAIIGLMVVLPFVDGYWNPEASGPAASFLPASFGFGIISLIAFALMPNDSQLREKDHPASQSDSAPALWSRITTGGQFGWFLCAFSLFMDAILTVQNNLSVYFEKTNGFGSNEVAVLFMTLFAASAVGGLGSIKILENLPAAALLRSLLPLWVLALLGFGVASGFPANLALLTICGILFGATSNAFRVEFLRFVPGSQSGKYFGVYTSFERTASLLGPAVWAAVIFLSNGSEIYRYRAAMVTMTVFIILSCLALQMMKRSRGD